MNDNRQIAINSLLNLTNNYKKLSDGTYIGKELYNDLKKLVQLELKKKYKLNNYKLKKQNEIDIFNDRRAQEQQLEPISEVYEIIDLNKTNYSELKNAISEYFKKNSSKHQIDETDIELDKKKYKLDDIECDFNTIYKYTSTNNYEIYYKPELVLNENPKELAKIINDLKELEKIFKVDNYSSLDDMVKIDFYKELITNIEKINEIFKKNDPDITKDLIENIEKKLKSLYNLKEPRKNKYKDDFQKEFTEFIKKKLSIRGGTENKKYTQDDINNIIKFLQNIRKNINNKKLSDNLKKNLKSIKSIGNPVINKFITHIENSDLNDDKIIKNLKDGTNYLLLYFTLIKIYNYFKNKNGGNSKVGGAAPLAKLDNISQKNTIDDNNDENMLLDIYKNIVKNFKSISLIYHIVKDEPIDDHIKLTKFLDDDDYTGDAATTTATTTANTTVPNAPPPSGNRDNSTKNTTEMLIDQKEKSKNIKNNLEKRRKLLIEKKGAIIKTLKDLYKNLISLKNLPHITEYEDEVKHILKINNIQQFETDEDDIISSNPIINEFEYDIKNVNNELEKYDQMIKSTEEKIEIKNKELNASTGNSGILFARSNEIPGGMSTTLNKGGSATNNEEYGNYKIYEYNNLYKLFNKDTPNNLYKLVENLHDNIGNSDDVGNNTKLNDYSYNKKDNNIYSTIWKNYTKSLIPESKDDVKKQDFIFLDQGEKLYNDVLMNKLNPEEVLEINLQDKASYIFMTFLLRTAIIIILDILIEYNLIKTLHFSILFYGTFYILFIIFLILFVNYDSYKLRILFNYLNLHINYSNIFIQNVLFIIFLMLIYIMVKSKDFLKYFGTIFDFTNVYNNIYELSESLNNDSDINLTKKEKLKLLYQIDIISMIIFIFDSLIILIL